MSVLFTILLVSWAAGFAVFAGGLIARFEMSAETGLKKELIHGIIAFGGGILVSAVAFALVPEGIRVLPSAVLIAVFCGGGAVFCLADAYISRRSGSKAQFMAMLLDFIPEAVSMGAVFVHDHSLGILLALFIGAQNLPEGFNSFREIRESGGKPRNILSIFFALSFLGPIAASLGYGLLQTHEKVTAGLMAFAGGGILYLVFQDIAPQSKMQKHWVPPLGAVIGFTVGIIGKQVTGL